MKFFTFSLRVTPHVPFISLRELNGHDELLTDGNDSAAILRLINSLIVPYSASPAPAAEKISISDRDYLLTCVYKYSYGKRIDSHLDCDACHERFDINFSLDDLVNHSSSRTITRQADKQGFFFNDSGLRFRLPSGEDELAVYGLPSEKASQLMLERCVDPQSIQVDTAELLNTMEEWAPVLVIDTETNCPECGKTQPIRFDMQSFLLAKMTSEKKRVATEVHCIASAYHWSHKEILDLPRSLRGLYVQMIASTS